MTLSPALKWVAIAAIACTGLIHFTEARDAFGDATYKGVLFLANGVGSLVAAWGVYRDRRGLGWMLGLVIAAGSVAAYVLSRTVGLPGLPAEPENWLEAPGVASLVCEGAFILLFFAAERARGAGDGRPTR
ncbi:MAG TPA: hypothetical protein VEI06_16190 [Gemmatimonadaceae bacterium]|nr:hypothetical protein [Gemmatimonadaceae bacterium]